MNYLFLFLYNSLLVLAHVILFPFFVIKGKYRQSLGKRLGLNFPRIEESDRKVIWVHAVSLGETKAVTKLAKRLKDENPDCIMIHSSVTNTGHKEGKKSLSFANYHIYLPFDLFFIIRPIIKKIQPDLVILSETDFWYNFLKYSKMYGAKIILVNGKLSEKSQKLFQRFSFITKNLLQFIDLFCLQNSTYLNRFTCLNVEDSKLCVTGNLKFDNSPQKVTVPCKHKNEINIVAGSTHSPEEEILLSIFQDIWKEFSAVKLYLVPRHPERFDEVEKLINNQNISYDLYRKSSHTQKLILVNQMGVLNECYSIADIAIVCGSFTDKVGGHNILEPLWYGVPVLFGPYMFQQPEMDTLVLQNNAGIQSTKSDLKEHLLSLIKHSQRRLEMGTAGKKLVHSLSGATNRTLNKIYEIASCVKN